MWGKIVGVGLAAIGAGIVAACATTGRRRDFDLVEGLGGPCPGGEPVCACADETKGWVNGLRPLEGDRVLIGTIPVDTRNSMVSVRRWGGVNTYLPRQNFFFEFGTAVPTEKSSFDLSVRMLVGHVLHYFGGYVCVNTLTGNNPTVYVVGGTDRAGSDVFNQTLSEGRARVVAEGVRELLSWNRARLPQRVKIAYAGIGERLAIDAGLPDGAQNERFRQVKVGVSNMGPPAYGSGTSWIELGTIEPGR